VLLAIAAPTAAGAGMTGSSASRACETALRSKVRANHPNSGRVEVSSANAQQSKGQITIRGAGRVETRDAGWRRLTFDCIYNTKHGDVASLRYDICTANGGTQATPSYVCKRAVAKRIHKDHPASGRIRWLVSSIREQPSDALTLVTGSGRIQTQDGNWRKFTFNCTYDNRSGRAKRASAKF
jgi:hypothetical protein